MIVDALHESLVRSALFPFTQYLYNRRGIRSAYRRSARTEYWTTDQIEALQVQRLKAVLENANRYVPYYERIFKESGMSPSDISTLGDVRHIPALSRNDVIAHKNDLVDRRFRASVESADSSKRGPAEPIPFARFKRHRLVRNTSSGSTGAPTVFYEDGHVSAMSWANELRVKRWFGINAGQREARLVRASPDYVLKSKANRIRRLLWNQWMLPGVNLQKKDYELIADQLAQFRPKVIWAFTAAAAGLARYLMDEGQPNPPWAPALIIPWAAPLYDHEREVMQQGFGSAISNIYGLREVGHVGSICPNGSLHVFQETHLLERDEDGELLVTFLGRSPMPFIRYRTGDIGEPAYEKCACGRNLQVIKRFYGRTGEVYVTPDGRMFSPNFWCRTFMDARLAATVRRFQIIYRRDNSIQVKLIVDEAHRPAVEAALERTIRHNFGERTTASFDYVDDIAPQISGKYQMVIVEK